MGLAVEVHELDALIEKAAKRGYVWHQFRFDRHGPEVLAGVFEWGGCADVVVLTDEKGSHAYRTPTDRTTDVFAPSHVTWWYGRSDETVTARGNVLPGISMVWVLRALLTLPEPTVPDVLLPLVPAPKGTGVPGDRIPVRIRRRLGR